MPPPPVVGWGVGVGLVTGTTVSAVAEVAKTLPVVAKVMTDAPLPAVSLSVPLHVDARAADNWDEAH